MQTLYTAKYVLPITTPPIEDGALLVAAGRIEAVGKSTELRQLAPGAELVSYPQGILLPPLVNAHTHLELSDFPLWAGDLEEPGEPGDFIGWIERVIRVKRQLDPDRYQAAVAHGIAASLRAGTGAVGDILSQFAAREAHRSSPLLGRLFFEAVGRLPEPTRKLRLQLAKLLRDEGTIGRLQTGLAPHAPYSLAADFLEDLLGFAAREELPCTMHLAESAAEAEFLRDAGGPFAERFYPLVGWGEHIPPGSGLSPVAWLAERGGLQPWNLLVHGVQLDAADVAQVARSGASVVLCPRSNARLQVGQAPLALYLDAGVKLALGTDSLASNDSLSIWDEIAFAWPEFSRSGSAAQLLQMATRNGADALGLAGELGILQPGYGAHFQVLADAPELPPARIAEFLCSRAGELKVTQLVLAGKECLPIP